MLPKIDTWKFGFTIMQMIGECKEHTSTRVIIFRIFNALMFALMLVLVSLRVFNVEPEKYVDVMAGFIAFFHVAMKYFWFACNQPTFISFSTVHKKFWKSNNFSVKTIEDIQFLEKAVKRLYLMLGVGCFCTGTLYGMQPYFSENRKYIFEIGIEANSDFLRIFLSLLQYHFVVLTAFVILGYDYIYISFCGQIAIQLRLLKQVMEDLGPGLNRKKLAEYIKHHSLILGLASTLKRQYSWIFFMQYFITVISICGELFLLSTIEVDKIVSIRSIAYLSYILMQFAIYCVPAEKVGSEILGLSDAIYMSKWYEICTGYGKDLLFSIIASQSRGYFTIGGLMDMNLQALVSVFRKAFSFYTIINSVLKK